MIKQSFCFVCLCLVYLMLPVSLDCPPQIAAAVFSSFLWSDRVFVLFVFVLNKNSVWSSEVRENCSSNLRWTIQRNWQHKVHKTKTNKTKTLSDHQKCLVYLMLPVSLDCPPQIAAAVFSNFLWSDRVFVLFVFVLCTLCCDKQNKNSVWS
jgi:predicted acyltransferase